MSNMEPVGSIRERLRDRLAKRLVEAAVAKGADRKKAQEAVDEMVGERPIIDWLLSVDWEALIAFVIKLIALL